MTRRIAMSAALVGLFGLGGLGCGSSNVTPAQISEPREQIAAAEEAGAREIPAASLHLQLAEEQYQKAKLEIEDGETETPQLRLKRASADAELALVMARQKTTRDRAATTIQKVNDLRQQRYDVTE